MTKPKAAIILAAVLIVFGVAYAISQQRDNNSQSETSVEQTSQNRGSTLDLSNKQLTQLPDSALSDTGIAQLNISNNQLTDLPEDISRLQKLEVLNVENNRLSSIPGTIGQLKNLTTLDLSNNRLESLPSELGNLTQLKTLKLSGYKGPQSDIEQLKNKLPNTEITT
ncbi:MAG: leucine-rich repeat-containing protein 40-like [Candidatus Saccharibacteria bacterium]|nr:leucine-rich repeat-containing protein 40-like [Candidatus Saccharibacteria bacterium]